ncbi:MAG: PD40 domain-containing protein [Acidobacteria bacterium]|nr:PD40 domain-containing protein [Acidobacteriota bacterium]
MDRIVGSVEFAQAGKLQRLLRFLAAQALSVNPTSIKETIIGVEVFDREPGYDPKIDSVVRTEVRRLRLKLQDYYAGSGSGETLRIEIPKGAYQVNFVESAPPVDPPPAAPVSALPHTANWPLRIGIGLGALVLLVLVASALRSPAPPRASASADPALLTSSIGQATHPSLSADGNMLVYAYAEGDNSGIYTLRLDARSSPVRLNGTRVRDFNPVIDQAGKQIAFLREESASQWALMVQAIAEAEPKRWATLDRRDRVAWLPGGKRMIVSLRPNPTGPALLALIDAAGARTIVTSPPAGTLYDGAPTLSPDGRMLAFSRATDNSVDEIHTVALGPDFLPTAEPRRLTNEKRRTSGFCFSPDGLAIIASLQRGRSIRGLYRIPVSNPEIIERVPEAGLRASYPTVAPAAGRVVYSIGTDDLNLYRRSGSAPPVPLSPSATLDSSPALSPDGKQIAFRSARSGASEIWVMNVDGANPRRLTHFDGPVTGSPRWSPDGKWIAYDTRPDGHSDIYLISPDGKTNRRLTSQPANEVVPGWSRDSRFVYFASDQNGGWELWKAPVDATGAARQVSVSGGFRAEESPDGKWLYYSKRDPKPGLWRLPLSGGQEEQVLPLTDALWGGWTLARDGVVLLDTKAKPPAYVYQGQGGREAQPIQNAPVLWESSVAVSADGVDLIYGQLDKTISDLYRIDLPR